MAPLVVPQVRILSTRGFYYKLVFKWVVGVMATREDLTLESGDRNFYHLPY